MTDWKLNNPPVWEAAIGAVTQLATVYDHFDIAKVHDLFSKTFPRVERQPPLPELVPFIAQDALIPIGVPQLQIKALQTPGPERWWFSSTDGHNLFQIQDDFVSRNWRRTDVSRAPDQHYPAFDGLLSDFRSGVDGLKQYHRAAGREMPNPRLCDVLYVNHLNAVREDGSTRRFREMLPWMAFNEEIIKGQLFISWVEKIDEAGLSLNVQAQFLAMSVPDGTGATTISQFMRLAFNARGACSSWEEHYRIAEEAHAYMRERLLALTSDELQATWRA